MNKSITILYKLKNQGLDFPMDSDNWRNLDFIMIKKKGIFFFFEDFGFLFFLLKLVGYICTAIIRTTRYSFGFWSIIRLCWKDSQAVQGVQLELLCRLLFTEGSNPSLSVSVT